MTQPAYCTILARNYLPYALALSESLQQQGSELPLTVFLTDATAESELPEVDGVSWMHPGMLDAPERQLLELEMAYDLVEFATAVKPLVLGKLLDEHERVFYLDPDTYAVAPMEELAPALDASPGGILLTPHYLEPTPSDGEFSDGHLLHVGAYNLGFCGVDRRARDFLSWWWGHLSTECLHDPIAGLFVDQKWVDIGSVYFQASPLRHYGYNVGLANLHERPVGRDADGYYIAGTDDRLRLFHFHGFDPRRPDELSTRFKTSHPEGFNTSELGTEALVGLCEDYAAVLLQKEREIGPQPDYLYGSDTTGRRITRRLRHAYRVAALAEPGRVPSPFVAAEAAEFEHWRKGARGLVGRLMLSDVVKGIRCALPEEYDNVRRRLPGLTSRVRGRIVEKSGMWG
ncbi:MAG TPA: hypothetical protein VH329_06355 [Solirubrobacterales bacterium]|jgi:hypothetical protein